MIKAKTLEKLKGKARSIKQNVFVLFLSYKDSRVPWYTKLFTICVVAYAFSPIDLIPDFIPILGYLDDLIIVPLGIALALKMIPEPVLIDCREKAEEIRINGKPKNWITGIIFIVIWTLLALWVGMVFFKMLT